MSDFERVWEECWTRVSRGEATIEDCVRRYPEHAEALSGLFKAVVRLNEGRLVRPNAAFKARARAAMLEQIRTHPELRAGRRDAASTRGITIPFIFRMGFALAVVLFLLLVSGTVLAQAALPGDPLYSWKTGSENVFRAVYPDPLSADLIVMNRRANELARVAGTPVAENIAAEGYQQVLSDLPRYSDPSSERRIREQLTEQKTQLQRAGVTVPAIDRTLKTLQAAPAITPPPAGGAPGGKTTPVAPAAATPTQTPHPGLTAKPTTARTAAPASTGRPTPTPTPVHTPSATAAVTHTPGGTSTTSHTPSAKSSPSAASNAQATDALPTPTASGETPTATFNALTATLTPSRGNTPTSTPCISQSSVFSVPTADACATPSGDCGTATVEQSPCETPTGAGTANPSDPSIPAPPRAPKHTPNGNGETSPSDSAPPVRFQRDGFPGR